MTQPSFVQAKASNQLRQCLAPGCALARHSINRYCKAHYEQAKKYGSPTARPLRPSLWASERAAVRELLHANADHPGLQQVLAYLAHWSERACANERAFKGAEELARLARHGVKPLDIVIEVAACSYWLEANPRALTDDRARDFAISRAVFELAPRPRRLTRYQPAGAKTSPNHSYSRKARTSAMNYVGTHLRTVLAPFLANVTLSLESRAEQKAQQEAAMRTPLRAAVTF